jgi:hypothetical protein
VLLDEVEATGESRGKGRRDGMAAIGQGLAGSDGRNTKATAAITWLH